MTAATQSIVTSYEDLGMTPEEISLSEGDLDLVSVKATLMQFSTKYRKDMQVNDKLEFTDDEANIAKRTIVEVMTSSDDDNLRLRAALYLRNDKKGRLDVAKQMNGLNINVLQFNADLQKAMKACSRSAKEVVDVASKVLSNGDSEE